MEMKTIVCTCLQAFSRIQLGNWNWEIQHIVQTLKKNPHKIHFIIDKISVSPHTTGVGVGGGGTKLPNKEYVYLFHISLGFSNW